MVETAGVNQKLMDSQLQYFHYQLSLVLHIQGMQGNQEREKF